MTVDKSNTGSSKGKVLLTGGSGFIAAHVLDSLLDHDFEVVVTARSEEKGNRILKSIDNMDGKKRVSFVVVGNISDEGAFDEAVESDPPFDYVVHTASPYQLHWDDPVKDCLDPAIKGTTGILRSIKAYAPSVKRVVVTSSSAAVLNPPNHLPVYDETSWSQITWEEAMEPTKTYRASKKFAEKAAWDFITNEHPNFDLATINNTYTFGPIQRSLPSLEAMNTSNHRIRNMVQGNMRDEIASTAPVWTFVDVRDVALAHVRAMTVPEAGGERFYLNAGYFSNARIASIIRGSDKYTKLLGDKLPSEELIKSSEDFPDDHWGFDNSKSKRVLGLEYTGLEKSVLDTVESIVNFEGLE